MTEITDADRKAAAAFKDSVFVHPDILARAFAAHRLQERDRVVAWLRDQAGVAEDKAERAVASGNERGARDYFAGKISIAAASHEIASGAHDQEQG